jgi:hypothetical protein
MQPGEERFDKTHEQMRGEIMFELARMPRSRSPRRSPCTMILKKQRLLGSKESKERGEANEGRASLYSEDET